MPNDEIKKPYKPLNESTDSTAIGNNTFEKNSNNYVRRNSDLPMEVSSEKPAFNRPNKPSGKDGE